MPSMRPRSRRVCIVGTISLGSWLAHSWTFLELDWTFLFPHSSNNWQLQLCWWAISSKSWLFGQIGAQSQKVLFRIVKKYPLIDVLQSAMFTETFPKPVNAGNKFKKLNEMLILQSKTKSSITVAKWQKMESIAGFWRRHLCSCQGNSFRLEEFLVSVRHFSLLFQTLPRSVAIFNFANGTFLMAIDSIILQFTGIFLFRFYNIILLVEKTWISIC